MLEKCGGLFYSDSTNMENQTMCARPEVFRKTEDEHIWRSKVQKKGKKKKEEEQSSDAGVPATACSTVSNSDDSHGLCLGSVGSQSLKHLVSQVSSFVTLSVANLFEKHNS
jgi:hypothetical protein